MINWEEELKKRAKEISVGNTVKVVKCSNSDCNGEIFVVREIRNGEYWGADRYSHYPYYFKNELEKVE